MSKAPFSRTRAERGAVTTLVAVLLAMGVVFGFLAISVDVGQLMYERGQQQNSADASALSLARSCSKGASTCVPNANSLGTVNDANSYDGLNAFESQCGVNLPTGSTLPTCGTASGAWADCSPLPPALAAMTNLPYVEVRTKSKSSGGNFIKNWFAAANGNSSTSSVGACSRSAWGSPYPGGGGELPITLSACDWHNATGGSLGGGGGSYYTPPDYTTYPTITITGKTYPAGYGGSGTQKWPQGAVAAPGYNVGQEVVMVIQNPPGGAIAASSCPTWNGHPLPGGFAVLQTVAGNPCKLNLLALNWVQTDPGNNTSCDLSTYVGKVVSVPVFDCTESTLPGTEPTIPPAAPNPALDCTSGNGSNAYYHLAGYAAFYLSGFRVNVTGGPSNRVKSINPNNSLTNTDNPCPNSNSCISGWFTTGSVAATAIQGGGSGGGYYGTVAIVPGG